MNILQIKPGGFHFQNIANIFFENISSPVFFLNKVRNLQKPQLGEYVQPGNIRSITYIVKGVPFIKKIVSKNILKKILVLKYIGS